MRMMKKLTVWLLCLCIAVMLFSGCSGPEPRLEGKIVVTNFAVYDWVRQILGENPAGLEVVYLLDSGVDLHSFQPTADDIMQVQTASLFYYVSDWSETWVSNALKTTGSEGAAITDIVHDDLKCADDHDHDHDHEHEHDEHTHTYDEHIWISLKLAQKVCMAIFADIAGLDPENREIYRQNYESYMEKLSELDGKYAQVVENGEKDTVLFADRFPFLYLFSDYGLKYESAFSGCSSESDASFETITRLAGVIDSKDLKSVMTIEGSRGNVANAIISATQKKDMKVLSVNSMQTITKKDMEKGITYLQLMEQNLSVLQEALK